MKTWRFTFKCEYFGAQTEFTFFVDADTYHDATVLADAYVKEKFPIEREQDLATIKFEGLGIDPKDWGKSKRALQEPCEYCKPKPKLLFENILELMVISGTLDIEVEGDYSGSGISDYVDINYCPMCGRKLEV